MHPAWLAWQTTGVVIFHQEVSISCTDYIPNFLCFVIPNVQRQGSDKQGKKPSTFSVVHPPIITTSKYKRSQQSQFSLRFKSMKTKDARSLVCTITILRKKISTILCKWVPRDRLEFSLPLFCTAITHSGTLNCIVWAVFAINLAAHSTMVLSRSKPFEFCLTNVAEFHVAVFLPLFFWQRKSSFLWLYVV